MKVKIARIRTPRVNFSRKRLFAATAMLTVVSIATLAGVFTVYAQNGSVYFYPGNLVVTRSLYVDTGSVSAGVTVLPPNCSPANCPPPPVTAVTSSAYPYVFNNDTVDGNFGITSKIFLDQITPTGMLVTSLEVPNSSQNGVPPTKDQIVTSFSSKSELALNLSTDGNYLTFMGYFASIGAIDVSGLLHLAEAYCIFSLSQNLAFCGTPFLTLTFNLTRKPLTWAAASSERIVRHSDKACWVARLVPTCRHPNCNPR